MSAEERAGMGEKMSLGWENMSKESKEAFREVRPSLAVLS